MKEGTFKGFKYSIKRTGFVIDGLVEYQAINGHEILDETEEEAIKFLERKLKRHINNYIKTGDIF